LTVSRNTFGNCGSIFFDKRRGERRELAPRVLFSGHGMIPLYVLCVRGHRGRVPPPGFTLSDSVQLAAIPVHPRHRSAPSQTPTGCRRAAGSVWPCRKESWATTSIRHLDPT